MMEFQIPELVLLAIPLWYFLYRRGCVPGETVWLLAVPVWLVFTFLDFSRLESEWLRTAFMVCQRFSVWFLPVPVWLGLRRHSGKMRVTDWLRFSILVLLVVCLGGPRFNVGGTGVDVIVVIDRSGSLSEKAAKTIAELDKSLDGHRRAGDRLGRVVFGSEARIASILSEFRRPAQSGLGVNADGSDLNDALLKALSLVDSNRPARILVLSDGESNGRPPFTAARRAGEERVPIDYRLFERMHAGDVAVKSLDVPEDVYPNEPFYFTAVIHSDGVSRGTIRLFRVTHEKGAPLRKLIREKFRRFRSGLNIEQFQHQSESPGTFTYEIEVEVAGDPERGNNSCAGVVRVVGPPRLLLLVRDKKAAQSRLASILTDPKAKLTVDVRVTKEQPLTKDQLDLYRAVIIDNVPADHLSHLKMARLSQFVRYRGLGLMLTGGENSFGRGGYFKSPLDKILPVSMEMREEDRKLRVAMAIVLDCSGSMSQPVSGGRTKMDLANLGTEECVNLLSRTDMVTVISVDTEAHIDQPLVHVENKAAIARRIHRITHRQGGIFADVALTAARKEIEKARGYGTRHIILFSDARDTEISSSFSVLSEDAKKKKLIRQVESLRAAGITVSVIGLGRKTDIHAGLLTEIANSGGGNIMFASDARDLPRLFAQDTLKVARNTFIRKSKSQPTGIPGKRTGTNSLIGDLGSGDFPHVDGYNLSYLRRGAQQAVRSADRYKAPWSAFWNRGLGRVAAITLDVSGEFSGAFGRWHPSNGFLLTHARWLLGGDNPTRLFVTMSREGRIGIATVELNPPKPGEPRSIPRQLYLIPDGLETGKPLSAEFIWEGRDTLRARIPLFKAGVYRTTIAFGSQTSRAAPSIVLPYTIEKFPRDDVPTGRETLKQLAELSGGRELTDVSEVLDRANLPRSPRMVSLLPWLLSVVIGLLLLEIAGRRLSLWKRIPSTNEKEAVRSPRWRPKWAVVRNWISRKRQAKIRSTTGDVNPTEGVQEQPAPASTVETASTASMARMLEQAKQRARHRHSE